MRKYKFLMLFIVVAAVFLVLSWFIYDGIDVFFELVYSPTNETKKVVKTETPKTRPKYVIEDDKKEEVEREELPTPDTRYIKTQRADLRENAFEKFLVRIFPEQLDYVLNPYTFFLILILTVLPIIGIFIYLIIYYLR